MTVLPTISPASIRVTEPSNPAEGHMHPLRPWLDQLPPLPALTGVLGKCADGLPVLFDLHDDRPGALLVCADPGAGKTRVLQTLLLSTLSMNNPREVQFALLADSLDPWRPVLRGLQVARYGLAVARIADEQARSWINRLAELVRSRRDDGVSGPAILMMIDGYHHLPLTEPELRWQLDWLLEAGPAVGVWPVASINALAAHKLRDSLLRFGTRIFGQIQDTELRTRLAVADLPLAADGSVSEFSVCIDGQWLQFQPAG